MSDCKGIKLFSGSSNPDLAKRIASRVGVPLGKCKVGKFANGETSVILEESVRNYDVYIVQSLSNPNLNDNLMELLIMADGFRRASPSRVTAIVPYFGYSRQDKKETGRAPITLKLIAKLMQKAGVERIITVDIHSPVTKGFWDIPVENLSVEPYFVRWVKRNILEHLDEDDDYGNHIYMTGSPRVDPKSREAFKIHDQAEKVVVSPDEGGAGRAKSLADKLGLDLAVIYQRRNQSVTAELVGNVEGKVAILIDDMADTCTKFKIAVEVLKQKGAVSIHYLCTHGLFSTDEALIRIKDAAIPTPINNSGDSNEEDGNGITLDKCVLNECVVTNSIIASQDMKNCKLIKRIDIAPIIAESVRRQHYGEFGSFSLELTV